eukprot:9195156-Pyramimonas_sp.AAC.1
MLTTEEPWSDLFGLLDLDADNSEVFDNLVLSCMQMASEYDRRLRREYTTFPHLIVWLIFSPPEEACAYRKQCAEDLLKLPAEQL